MELKLIVLRSVDIKKLADFYGLLGLTLDYHKHGNSPYHYSAMIEKTVLEIYPLAKGQTESDKYLRLGLTLDNFEEVITALKEKEVIFSSEPSQTEFGFMAIISDPDGRKIELYKK